MRRLHLLLLVLLWPCLMILVYGKNANRCPSESATLLLYQLCLPILNDMFSVMETTIFSLEAICAFKQSDQQGV
jgi:hypothetical protein